MTSPRSTWGTPSSLDQGRIQGGKGAVPLPRDIKGWRSPPPPFVLSAITLLKSEAKE